MKPLLPKESTAAAGYLILCITITGLFALAYQDAMFIIFAIFLLLIFLIGASIGIGKPEEDLELVGWSGKNMEFVIPFGIAGGMVSFLIGLYITRNIEPSSMYTFPLQVFVPDLSTTGAAFTAITAASVIPPIFSTAANILGQWFVIAPSEEALSKVIVPYAGLSITKNWVLAYIFGSLFWVAYHVPKFVAQDTDGRMYLVLLFIALINVILVIFTRNVLAGVISHAVYNTDVTIYPGLNQTAFYTILALLAILMFIWFWSKKPKTARGKLSGV